MDILAESRLTFRQGHTVQPFAMVSGKQVCGYQDIVSKEIERSQTRSMLLGDKIVQSDKTVQFCPVVRLMFDQQSS